MRFVRLLAATSALACSTLAGQAQAAKVFTVSGAVDSMSSGFGSWVQDLPFPASTTPSWTRGFTIQFSAPFFGAVTFLPSGWYSRTDPYDNEWANDLAEVSTEITGGKSLAFHFPSRSYRSGGWSYTEYFLGAGIGVDNWSDTPINFTINGFAAVTEPVTWALMILGFGAIGGAMRRRPAARHADVERKLVRP